MTANEMIPAVGATVKVRFEDLKITCKVVDVKTSWGKARLLIEPVAGEGTQWVELGRVVDLAPVERVKEWNRHYTDAREFGRDANRAVAIADVLTFGQTTEVK